MNKEDRQKKIKELEELVLKSKKEIDKLRAEDYEEEKEEERKQFIALAVNSQTNECTIISSKASYEMLKNDFELYEKKFIPTNWGGRDEISRTCELEEIGLTGNKFKYKGKISGYDSDHGHSYGWTFEFDEVWEVKKKSELVYKVNNYDPDPRNGFVEFD